MLALLSMLIALDTGAPRPETPAPPQVYFSLLDIGGVSKTVTVQSLDAEGLATTDLDGRRRTEPLARVIMMSRAATQPAQLPKFAAPAPEAPTQTPTGVLHTVDGQVIAGHLVREGREKDALLWRSQLTGTLRVPLDLLKRLDCTYPPGGMLDGVVVTKDTLFLRNGDVVSGFVDSIGESVQIETGGDATRQMVKMPLDRIEAVLLAQNLAAPKGSVVATRSGVVVQIRGPLIRNRTLEGSLTLASASEKLSINDGEIDTLVFDAGRVQPLSLCKFHDVAAVSERAWTRPVEFRQMGRGGFGSELELPGPMQVDCDLPRGARRLLLHAELPHSCRTWGDPELVLSAKQGTDFKELKRIKLSGDSPEADVNIELNDAPQLRMTVEAGAAGPIQDRVVLRHALVLIEPGAGKSKATPNSPSVR